MVESIDSIRLYLLIKNEMDSFLSTLYIKGLATPTFYSLLDRLTLTRRGLRILNQTGGGPNGPPRFQPNNEFYKFCFYRGLDTGSFEFINLGPHILTLK